MLIPLLWPKNVKNDTISRYINPCLNPRKANEIEQRFVKCYNNQIKPKPISFLVSCTKTLPFLQDLHIPNMPVVVLFYVSPVHACAFHCLIVSFEMISRSIYISIQARMCALSCKEMV